MDLKIIWNLEIFSKLKKKFKQIFEDYDLKEASKECWMISNYFKISTKIWNYLLFSKVDFKEIFQNIFKIFKKELKRFKGNYFIIQSF